ncbi:hypothetical protein [Arachidicoccus sp.]|uniref:hypothetical protein n=1 Tax=Arachidicoccus sp. TaxID=1872624 RepID=UPI003D1F6739
MKYSQTLGIAFSFLLIVACFLPWCSIASKNIVISGMETTGTVLGKPGYMHIFFAVFSILFFSIPKVWSKRINLVVMALNFAWAMRNYLLMSTCSAGDCPEKKIGIYLVIISSILMFLMAFLPKIKLKED